MTKQWIVVLEAAGDGAGTPISVADLRELMEALADATPGALHDESRYAISMHVHAGTPAEAVFVALCRWADAAHRLALPEWEVVRTEVMTPEELEGEWRLADGAPPYLDETASERHAQRQGRLRADELLRTALHDSVTDLASRELFLANVGHALEHPLALEACPAIVVLDIDDFTVVNEQLGHVAGDQVLSSVASRLVPLLRQVDVAARLDGDQFAILLHHSTVEDALGVAQRLVDAVRAPVRVAGSEVAVSASAGVAICHPGAQPEAVVREAEVAARAAKAAGPGRCQIAGDVPLAAAPSGSGESTGRVVHDRLAALLLLKQAAVAANEATALEDAVGAVLEDVCQLTGWPIGHVYQVNERGDGVVSISIWRDVDPARFRRFREQTERTFFSRRQGLPGRVLATGRAAWISDITGDDNFPRRDAALACGIRAAFAFPVLVGSEVVAILEFFAEESVAPNPALLEVMVIVGIQLGRVVERARAETAMRRSEQRFHALAESVNDAIVSIDSDGLVISWNRAAERMFGYSEAEILGQSLDRLIPERHRERHFRRMRRFVAEGERWGSGRTLVTEALRSDGTEVPVEMGLSKWETADGVFCTGILRDISERRFADAGTPHL